MTQEELLQARLERLEGGEPLELCLDGLGEQEAELLRLASGLRSVSLPERNREIAAHQRARFVRQITGAGRPRAATRGGSLGEMLRMWFRPRFAIAAAATFAAFIIIVVWLVGRNDGISPGSEQAVAVATLYPTAASTDAQANVVPTEEEPETHIFVPLFSGGPLQEAQTGRLETPKGLVQIEREDGTTISVDAGGYLRQGEWLRTGELSSVLLSFVDGSRVWVGPESALLLEEVEVDASSGRRVLVFNQPSGETAHQVAAGSAESRYVVNTPFGSAAARGTAFQVQVVPERFTQLSVDEGSVSLAAEAATVNVAAGQSTLVEADEAPADPAFRISGEGEISQTSPVWVIAGQSFETHQETIIVGDPQVGDWVHVEGRQFADGRRIADRIALVRSSPASRFTLIGRVEEMGETAWTVVGQTLRIDGRTVIDAGIEVGKLVRVEGYIQEEGALYAVRIHRLEEAPGLPFSFRGVVQEIASGTWRISGVAVLVDEDTAIDQGLELGDVVEVRGWILAGGSWLASVIERAEALERGFEITGVLESLDPWMVAGILFETRDWTVVEQNLEVGDLVRVTGRILEDGTWVADKVSHLEEPEEALTLVFVGRVESIEPWLVNGIPLQVDEQTAIDGDIAIGDLVKVTVRILTDGTWLATRIERLLFDEGGLGCVTVTAVVVGVEPELVELLNWPPVELDGIPVEGELQVGSVVLLVVCVDAEGNIHVTRIIVIYQPEPEPEVTPTPVPTPLPEDEAGHKVTICHKPGGKNPHTITVARSALPAHLGHGDTLGPCP